MAGSAGAVRGGVERFGAAAAGVTRHVRAMSCLLDYWWVVHRRTWRGTVVNSFLSPLLNLIAMGALLGRYVDAGRPDLQGAPSYLAFVAPGILCAHLMQCATGDALWPVYGRVKWSRVYESMIATPVRVVDVVAAHLVFIVCRVGVSAVVFMMVLIPCGVYVGAWGAMVAFGVQVLLILAFAAPFFAMAVSASSDSLFTLVLRLVVAPLMLLSGVFFPVSNLPVPLQVLSWCSPLFHGVEVTRALVLTPLNDVDWLMAAGHVGYLSVWALVGSWWSVRRMQRRLIA
ncbi:hypothetical protein KEM60_01377 [Austwickia sp. TVS 96-490-7B]|uniref:ABC transporter permease n=1 Tax=Austwickia sp. TVS 96-490-7B TaxID=2830843 RepID=UPI001D60EC78|nr:ABC transporter permease [Austwickia sp. TVS 96-490-7B]MBW3085180.1 hypothetical protein [Austwickia sp. TVS 96-490-7B]